MRDVRSHSGHPVFCLLLFFALGCDGSQALAPATNTSSDNGVPESSPLSHAATMEKSTPPEEPPDEIGRWSRPELFIPPDVDGLFIPVHATLLPTGRLLVWSHDGKDLYLEGATSGTSKNAFVWDPATGAWQKVSHDGVNLFCAGHTLLADGNVFVAGGHAGYPGLGEWAGLPDANVFDATEHHWSSLPKMNDGRWYPTAITLATGDVLVADGRDSTGRTHNLLPQVFEIGRGAWRNLGHALLTNHMQLYPWAFAAPDGRVFFAGPSEASFFLDTNDKGRITEGPVTVRKKWRLYGAAAMYAPGKIIVLGGTTDFFGPPDEIGASAELIDLGAAAPAWTSISPMAYPRMHPNATLLADGSVFVSGGTAVSDPGTGTLTSLAHAVYPTENWDPKTGRWSTWHNLDVPRMYHATALLLPDGRVFTGGGGLPGVSGETPLTAHQDMQIFSPPYLFKGPRPMLARAPVRVHYGENFRVESPDAPEIDAISWVRLGSVTHSWNSNQRFGWLDFSRAIPTPNDIQVPTLDVSAPSDRNLFPPGHYLMFLLRNGVPSIGHIIHIG